jgi:peptidoglycan/LPS O-acetylase OafA/YrhL
MNRGVSLYLDLVRFSAAVVVCLGHAGGQQFTGGLFWFIGLFAPAAVMIFFVLSGYVIAHVLTGRENSASEYAAARIARLYSVVIPAIVLTFFCEQIILANDPTFYFSRPRSVPLDDLPLHYLASVTFTNRFWTWSSSMEPTLNNPFWSLSYEGAYYVAAGLMVFTKGWLRIGTLGLLCALAGPAIVAFAPLWFAGFGIYLTSQTGFAFRQPSQLPQL